MTTGMLGGLWCTHFFFFLVIIVCFYWGLVALQRCIHFCCTTKWISYMHTYIPSLLDLPPAPILPIKVITEHCAEPPELYRRFPLAAYFTNGSVYVCAYVSILLSQFVPPSPPPPCTHIRPLYPHLSSCPANRLISTVTLEFHVYVLTYNICFSLSDLLHSVWQTLGSSTSLQILCPHTNYFKYDESSSFSSVLLGKVQWMWVEISDEIGRNKVSEAVETLNFSFLPCKLGLIITLHCLLEDWMTVWESVL